MLYILPFDHRSSFAKMFGFDYARLTEEGRATLIDYKYIIYEGFLVSLQKGISKENAAILVDEEFGSRILQEAKREGITHILTVEKSGGDELELEYGENFREHIDEFSPDYVKILLHYSPKDKEEKNARQIEKLTLAQNFCNEKRYKFLIELLIKNLRNEPKKLFEARTRARLTAISIKEFQEQGINPEIWKLEGLDSEDQLKEVVTQVKEGQKNNANVVILGRGENKEKVETWLKVGAAVEGVIGFAVGRTVFEKPLIQYHKKEISRDKCANTIAENFIHFVDIFENCQ